ncbi:MAG TPA: sulfurtransferase [Thermoanaerobaculia bacterium]|nr:sulfurtransferase [Thermoanaerobaculia bacterium]
MRNLSFLAVLLVAIPLGAQTLRDDMVVSTEWLSGNLENVTLIEIGDRDSFDSAHLPGAQLIERDNLVVRRGSIPNELPPVAALEALFSRVGAGNGGRIVLYSRDPILAARAWFTLDYLGHAARASILDGGFAKWAGEGRETTTELTLVEPVMFHGRPNLTAVVPFKTMKSLVRWRQELASNLVMIDSRSPNQFRGVEAGPDVSRPGHIPGAVSVPWDENFTAGAVQRLLPERELRELYAESGVSHKSTNVAYCRTGMQAAVTYFVLRYLGYGGMLYDGSFVEWSGESGTKVTAASVR